MFTRNFLALIIVLSTLNINAQDNAYYDPETGDEFAITPETSDSILELYLEANDLKEIEFNPNPTKRFLFRVQTKKGNWKLYDRRLYEFIQADKMSFDFPKPELERIGVTIATQKKKKYFFFLDDHTFVNFGYFNEIKPIELEAIAYKKNKETAKEEKIYITKYVFALKRKNKWGLVVFSSRFEDYIQLVAPFGYETVEEMPINDIVSNFKTLEYDIKNHIVNPLNYFYGSYSLDDYDRIELNPNEDSRFPFRLRDKKGDWYLADNEFMMFGEKGYSLSFPQIECSSFSVAQRKDKQFLYLLDEGSHLIEDFKFDEIKQSYEWKYTNNDSVPICKGFYLKKDSKWALAYWSYDNFQLNQLTGFHFDSSDDVPDSLLRPYLTTDDGVDPIYDGYLMNVTHDFLQSYQEADLVTIIGPYQYDQQILKMRHSGTKRWSLVIPGGFSESTDLPIAASKITEHFYDENKQVLEVWCDDKVGYYFYDGEDIKQIKNCEFDDFEYVFWDATYSCAMKRNGKWELFDVKSEEKRIDGNADSIEGLNELWLNR